jgi:hypothetical protein
MILFLKNKISLYKHFFFIMSGRNSERFNHIKLERKLVEVDSSIHRIRQELRFCGNLKKRQSSYI